MCLTSTSGPLCISLKGELRGGHSRHGNSRSKGVEAKEVREVLKIYEVCWKTEVPAVRIGRERRQGSPLGGGASHGMRSAFLRFGVGEGQWEMAGRKINKGRPQRSKQGKDGGSSRAPGFGWT